MGGKGRERQGGGHTPGPWRTEYDSDQAVTLLVGAGGTRLAELLSWNDADDRLIAAAPDLLAACERALAWMPAIRGIEGDAGALLTVIEALDEAIAKATGADR